MATSSVVTRLDTVLGGVRRVAYGAVILGGVMMLASAFMITADIILRRVFSVSTWGAGELSYYALAISSSWAFGYAMLVKAHIRIDAVSGLLPQRLRSACDVIALIAMGFFALIACLAILDDLERAWSRGATSITTLQTPLWIPQGLWLAGFIFFALVTILLLLRVAAALLLEHSHETVNHYAGSTTVQDETAAAIAEAEAASRGRD